MNTKEIELELGTGEVYIENMIVADEISIDGGIGRTELKVGATSLDLTGEKEDYTIKASKGLGNITLDGQTIESNKDYGNGKNYLDIDGGVGEIKIDFRD